MANPDSDDSSLSSPSCEACWIAHPDRCLINWEQATYPAPLFRREFHLPAVAREARLQICGLGYYELRLNGGKIGDCVLDPIPTQYDRRVRYTTYVVSKNLQEGSNAVGVMLGNGWYNSNSSEVWHFDKAPWRDYPKLLLALDIRLVTNEWLRIESGPGWKVSDGPVLFDALRNGETYDARREQTGWDLPGFNDANWSMARRVPGPGGFLQEQTSPPCKVMETLTPASVRSIRPGVAVFDFGVNIAGWAQLRVHGEPGEHIVLRYGERLKETGEVDQEHIAGFIRNGECQTDHYFCKGEGGEVWEPRFTYHGFQYVQVEGFNGEASIDMLRGRVVHTAFDSAGSFDCSNEDANCLQAATRRAYVGNFIGIPTDCPHRDKNGWTGDAQIAAETGLLNFRAASSYRQWLETLADTQRPSGQLPGIAPSAGWGYNWGSGPAWDAALVLIPGLIHLYTGDDGAIRDQYDAIRRYLDFCATLSENHILDFGLGDWCPAHEGHTPPAALTSTAYYYTFASETARYARILGHEDQIGEYEALAEHIRKSFTECFYHGNGIYGNGLLTAQGCALYHGLVAASELQKTVQRLVEAVKAAGITADFGLLGAKYVPRALSENGYADLAFQLITQPHYPGWVRWLRQGATTLWETWDGGKSLNHIMFGDISAWFYRTLAGIRPDPEQPGFRHIRLQPHFVEALKYVRAVHRSPRGAIDVAWRREGSTIEIDMEIPAGSTASLRHGALSPEMLPAGRHRIRLDG